VIADAAGHCGPTEAEAAAAAEPDKLGIPWGEMSRVPRRELP
jgi:hypothetical protein